MTESLSKSVTKVSCTDSYSMPKTNDIKERCDYGHLGSLAKGCWMTYRSPKYREPNEDAVVGTVAELFAGVGGFRIALARSGWKTVYSNQWEPSTKAQHASDCYVAH